MEYVTLGKIINVRGLKGEVKIKSFTDFASQRYKKGNKVSLFNPLTGNREEVSVKSYSNNGEFDYVVFEEISDVDVANKYREYEIQYPIDKIKDLRKGDYYYYQLRDCDVYYKGEHVGKVSAIEDNGRQDILRIKLHNGKSALVPFIDVFIKSVEVEEKKIYINEIEGLLWSLIS